MFLSEFTKIKSMLYLEHDTPYHQREKKYNIIFTSVSFQRGILITPLKKDVARKHHARSVVLL
jgi:hypothetical protein